MSKHTPNNTKARAFGKLALFAAALVAGASGLHADETVSTAREFKDGKELDGEGTLYIARSGRLIFTGEKTTVERAIEPAWNGRRHHGDGVIEVKNPQAELTLKLVLGNNEPGVYRRTHKIGPGTLVIAGEEDNSGAKFVIWEGTTIFAKDSDGGTHAQGNTEYLEIYSYPKDPNLIKPSVQGMPQGTTPGSVGVLVLGGKGGDQIADEAKVLIGGVHSDRGGVLDLNTRTETVGGLGLLNGTLRFAFGGAAGKTGTLTVEGEHTIGLEGQNTIEITEGEKWLPGTYNLVISPEEIEAEKLSTLTLKGISNGKLGLSANKRIIQLVVTKK
jgi:hypothetical protein